MIKKLLSSWFAKPSVEVESQVFDGFKVTPIIEEKNGRFYTQGTISKEIDGETRETYFIRADHHSSAEQATEHSFFKAQQIIKEQGDSIFQQERV